MNDIADQAAASIIRDLYGPRAVEMHEIMGRPLAGLLRDWQQAYADLVLKGDPEQPWGGIVPRNPSRPS